MGDYTKLVVNCSVKKTDAPEKLKQEIMDRIGLCSSAYHCGGELLDINNEWHHRTDITLITQKKWGNGIKEFLEWLKPQVINGIGDEDIYAFECSEYEGGLIIHKLLDEK